MIIHERIPPKVIHSIGVMIRVMKRKIENERINWKRSSNGKLSHKSKGTDTTGNFVAQPAK